MTNSSPPEPPNSRNQGLRRDEQLAVMVALAAIGAIAWWAIKLAPQSFDISNPDSWLNLGSANTPSEKLPTDGIFSTEPETTVGGRSDLPSNIDAADTGIIVTSPTEGRVGGIVPVPVPDCDRQCPVVTSSETTPSDGETTDSAVLTPAPEIPINPNLPKASPTDRIAFADIPAGYWALPFIDGLSERKVVAGLDAQDDNGDPIVNYEPERPVTRAEFASQLEKVFALPDRQQAKEFTDLPQDYWATPAIVESNEGNYMNGYPEGDFRPDRPIPRLELLVALATGLQLPLPENPDAILQVYEDGAQIPNWAKPKIAAATQAGMVAGHPNPKQFNPSLAATRAEVAATLYQALVVGKEAQPVESEYLVKPD
ncbi:MAG: S-layer homology domain-containing protein [Geitlerinemataceae cyanobacterium]